MGENQQRRVEAEGRRIWVDKEGAPHRTAGPAYESASGSKRWYVHGLLHREGGPAILVGNGSEYWYKFGVLHRGDDLPAIIDVGQGKQEWYFAGERHPKHLQAVLDGTRTPSARAQKLRAIGNGVIPMQAEAALRIMFARLREELPKQRELGIPLL